MQEFGTGIDTEIFTNFSKMSHCDLVILIYDSNDPNSFSYVSNLVLVIDFRF
jgi:Ras family protein T1